MIYSDQIEYNILDDTKPPLMPIFLFVSMRNFGDTRTNKQYIIYQTFDNVKSSMLLETFFHFKQNNMRNLKTDLQLKAFVNIATALRYRLLSTIRIQHNLFHHSNLGARSSSKTLTLFFYTHTVI